MIIPSLTEKVLGLTAAATRRFAPLAPLLLRLTVGVVFVGTGWGKLHSLGDVTEFFTGLGIPFPGVNARIVAFTELAGGLLVLLGLGTRLAALPLAFTMVIAIVTAKRDAIDGLTALVGFEEWSYLVMFLVLALVGPGAWSLDALWTRRWRGAAAAAVVSPATS
jgi:putative oxidoreductase